MEQRVVRSFEDRLLDERATQEIQGRGEETLRHYELAYAAMERTYAEQPQRVGLWLAEMGALSPHAQFVPTW